MSMFLAVDSSLAAASWTAGRIDIVGVNSTGHMLHMSWPSQSQNGWDVLGESFHTITPTILSQSDSSLDVFGLEQNTNRMLHSSWDGMDWSGWETVGTHQYYKSSLAATSWSDGRLDVFGLGLADRQVYRQWVCERSSARSSASANSVAVGRRDMVERLVAKRKRLRQRPGRNILDRRPPRHLRPRRREVTVPQLVRRWRLARSVGLTAGCLQESSRGGILRPVQA
jgi:hypothetical protein